MISFLYFHFLGMWRNSFFLFHLFFIGGSFFSYLIYSLVEKKALSIFFLSFRRHNSFSLFIFFSLCGRTILSVFFFSFSLKQFLSSSLKVGQHFFSPVHTGGISFLLYFYFSRTIFPSPRGEGKFSFFFSPSRMCVCVGKLFPAEVFQRTLHNSAPTQHGSSHSWCV